MKGEPMSLGGWMSGFMKLALVLLVGEACVLDVGTPIQSAWVVNNSQSPVIIRVDSTVTRWLVPGGSSGPAHGTSGRDQRGIQVLTDDCRLLAESQIVGLLTITVDRDLTVEFDPDASQSELEPHGSPPEETSACE